MNESRIKSCCKDVYPSQEAQYLVEAIDKKNTRRGREFFSTYEKAREKYDELIHNEEWGIVRMYGNGNQLFLHIDYRGIDKSMFNGNDNDIPK